MNQKQELQKPLLSPPSPELEPQSKLAITRPLSLDLFQASQWTESTLPEKIKNHPKLLKQAEDRRVLVTLLQTVFAQESKSLSHIFDLDFELFYLELTDFLNEDPNHARLLLYLPFSIWPNLKEPVVVAPELLATIKECATAFKDAWVRLLLEADPRASFVDGDIGEPGMKEFTWVYKAGHLIPELLKRGLIDQVDLEVTLTTLNSPDSMQSILEGVMVAADQNLLTASQKDKLIRIVEKQGLTYWFTTAEFKSTTDNHDSEPVAAESLISQLTRLNDSLNSIQNKPNEDSSSSVERVRWLKSVEQEKLMKATAEQLANQLLAGDLRLAEVRQLVFANETEPQLASTTVQAVILAGEKIVTANSEQATAFLPDALSLLTQLATQPNLNFQLKDALEGGLNKWLHSKLITKEQFAQAKLPEHNLEQPLPVDLPKLLETDWQFVANAVEKIKQHSVLSQKLFPVVLLFGSRLKGYAAANADTDGAIFFKPTTNWEERAHILELVKQEVPELAQIDKVLEYWTTESNEAISLRIIDSEEQTVIGPKQIHFMFGGAWVGDLAVISQLKQGITPRYLDLSRFEDEKEEVRRQLLRRMELDVVQYRLMHKGYARYYQTTEPLSTPHANLIDAESVFWDEGYRRVASQLFLSRVFLPDLI